MATVQSIERAFNLLEHLSGHPHGMQITRLAEETGLSKSTVHRLLSTLIELKYVKQDMDTERYTIGYRALYLSRNLINTSSLIATAKPYLQKLVEDINETIHLCVVEHEEVVYIDKIESNQTIRMSSRIGSRAPLYCTGVGKMILSGKTDEDVFDIAGRIEFIKKTPNTIITYDEFIEEIFQIRRQGFALDDVENEEGIRCIAVPIYDFSGEIVASFSVSGPCSRITLDWIQSGLAEKLSITAKEISLQLGFRN
ncbi:IclR family transcriptional regulator [Solibacillus silvestris]|uniref:IclR family transcriptional regulator n=1 Tax=Solibacillus silvestris TaxID=76853 RepID=UPI003F817CB2